MSRILVTGGSGFIGSGLVKALVRAGHHVRVLDDNSRGALRRLTEVEKDIEFIAGDVRDANAVARAAQGMDEVHHLAFVNGTEFFYTKPELVLDVGVRGMVNVIDACRKADVPLVVPDVMNPRYSYGAGKLISEVMAVNYGRKYFERVLIFRPHNVYGPDMGWEHVIPQFALRLKKLADAQKQGVLPFEMQGTGQETRSFCFIDDLVAEVMVMRDRGEHLGIYHIGTTEEVTIAELARRVARAAGREIELVSGPLQAGGTPRRCPDISKLAKLGYKPAVPLDIGLKTTLDWYWRNAKLAPKS
ncbi:MAG: SDR family NAD(P)-dependent oxidoreductase [Pseudolabrys sp.]